MFVYHHVTHNFPLISSGNVLPNCCSFSSLWFTWSSWTGEESCSTVSAHSWCWMLSFGPSTDTAPLYCLWWAEKTSWYMDLSGHRIHLDSLSFHLPRALAQRTWRHFSLSWCMSSNAVLSSLRGFIPTTASLAVPPKVKGEFSTWLLCTFCRLDPRFYNLALGISSSRTDRLFASLAPCMVLGGNCGPSFPTEQLQQVDFVPWKLRCSRLTSMFSPVCFYQMFLSLFQLTTKHFISRGARGKHEQQILKRGSFVLKCGLPPCFTSGSLTVKFSSSKGSYTSLAVILESFCLF